MYSKTCVKRPLSKRPQIGFQDELLLNAGQKYCRMLQWEHSALLSTFIKLPFVIKIFVLSIFEWLFYTGFTVLLHSSQCFSGLNILTWVLEPQNTVLDPPRKSSASLGALKIYIESIWRRVWEWNNAMH